MNVSNNEWLNTDENQKTAIHKVIDYNLPDQLQIILSI